VAARTNPQMFEAFLDRSKSILPAILFCFLGFRAFSDSSLDPRILLIGLKSVLVAGLFLFRTQPEKESRGFTKSLAYLSAFLPFAFLRNGSPIAEGGWFYKAGLIVCVAGDALATWALVHLGRSFGVSPAKRQLVASGPYRFLKHPIYLGYLISEISFFVLHFSIWNGALLVASASLMLFRAKAEEKILSDESVPKVGTATLMGTARAVWLGGLLLPASIALTVFAASVASGLWAHDRTSRAKTFDAQSEVLKQQVGTADFLSASLQLAALAHSLDWRCVDLNLNGQRTPVVSFPPTGCLSGEEISRIALDGAGGTSFELLYVPKFWTSNRIALFSFVPVLILVMSAFVFLAYRSKRTFEGLSAAVSSLIRELNGPSSRSLLGSSISKVRVLEIEILEDAIQERLATLEKISALESEKILAKERWDIALRVAHDLKAPLGALRIASSSIEDSEIRELVRESVSRLSRISADVLAPVTLRNSTTLKRLIHEQKSLISAHGGKLEVGIMGELEDLAVENSHLERVLQNLLMNAVEASKERVVFLQVREDLSELVFSIEAKDAIFPESVLQAQGNYSVQSSKSSGHGIGIMISCQMIKKWGGELSMRNLQGATLTSFTFPKPGDFARLESVHA
jgi:protein-S-isoprenylcysteine O-methyltransferase Ste14/signal transduction histidine kinase